MAEVIVFPDPEGALVSFITGRFVSGEFAGVKASTKVPTPRPTEFVRVLLIGGYDPTLVTQVCRFAVECWAGGEVRASRLARVVAAELKAAVRDGVVGSATVGHMSTISGPQNLPDPSSSQVRYTATYELHFRA